MFVIFLHCKVTPNRGLRKDYTFPNCTLCKEVIRLSPYVRVGDSAPPPWGKSINILFGILLYSLCYKEWTSPGQVTHLESSHALFFHLRIFSMIYLCMNPCIFYTLGYDLTLHFSNFKMNINGLGIILFYFFQVSLLKI